jgi:hypothetical protein
LLINEFEQNKVLFGLILNKANLCRRLEIFQIANEKTIAKLLPFTPTAGTRFQPSVEDCGYRH